MRKAISYILVIIFFITAIPVSVSAKEENTDYSKEELEFLYDYLYKPQEKIMEDLFCNPDNVRYWKLNKEYEKKPGEVEKLELASKILGEDLDKQGYAEILMNLITMQSGDLAEEIENQRQYDDLKSGMDYAEDVVDIIAGLISAHDGGEATKNIKDMMDILGAGKEMFNADLEQIKYYEMIVKDYSQGAVMLNAIIENTDNPELRAAAQDVLGGQELLLKKRVEYLQNTSGAMDKFSLKTMAHQLGYSLIQGTDEYLNNPKIKSIADYGNQVMNELAVLNGYGTAFFELMILAGDVWFGTTNTYKRYQEMKALSQIADAVVKESNETVVKKGSEDMLEDISKKEQLYKTLIITHCRGEYAIYQLVDQDGGILSIKHKYDEIKNNEEQTTAEWYESQTKIFQNYYDNFDEMYELWDQYLEDSNEQEENVDHNQEEESSVVIFQETWNTWGSNVNWRITTDGTLILKGNGSIASITNRNPKTPKWKYEEYEKLIIQEGITSIGDHTFNGEAIKEIELADTVTSIGYMTFRRCAQLQTIRFGSGLKKIGGQAFAGCESLQEIMLPNTVTSIDKLAFFECISLKKIIIPESVTEIGEHVFDGCNELTIYCVENSYAHNYAVKNNIPVVFVSE